MIAIRSAVVAAAFFVSLPVWAGFIYTTSETGALTFTSPQAACKAAATKQSQSGSANIKYTSHFWYSYDPNNGACKGTYTDKATQQPLFGGEPQVYTMLGRTGEASVCEAGRERKFVVPLGWTNDEAGVVSAGAAMVGGQVCLNGCAVTPEAIKDVFTRPSEPADDKGNKLVYGEYVGKTTGASCEGTTDFPEPPKPPSDDDDDGGGGSGPGDDDDDDDDREPPGDDCEGEKCGDPGPKKDPAGPGSGGSQGGVGDPDLPDDNNTESSCGGPGQPPCNTKIDETGTPRDGGERMSTERLNSEFTKLDNLLPDIYDRSTKDTTWGVTPSWFGSGTCQPFSFGDFMGQAFTINHCVAAPYAQGAASFMWVVGTFFAILALVFRSVGGSS